MSKGKQDLPNAKCKDELVLYLGMEFVNRSRIRLRSSFVVLLSSCQCVNFEIPILRLMDLEAFM